MLSNVSIIVSIIESFYVIASQYKAGFPLANIFARSDFFPLSLSFWLKPSGMIRLRQKQKSFRTTGFIPTSFFNYTLRIRIFSHTKIEQNLLKSFTHNSSIY